MLHSLSLKEVRNQIINIINQTNFSLMKRLSTLFLTLAALLLALPANVRADGGLLSIGDRITPDEIVDGLKVILEGGAEQESLGKYMPQLPTSADEGTNLSASLDEGCVYQFVDAGTTNSVSGDKEWYCSMFTPASM